jgi:hypothetical protein
MAYKLPVEIWSQILQIRFDGANTHSGCSCCLQKAIEEPFVEVLKLRLVCRLFSDILSKQIFGDIQWNAHRQDPATVCRMIEVNIDAIQSYRLYLPIETGNMYPQI